MCIHIFEESCELVSLCNLSPPGQCIWYVNLNAMDSCFSVLFELCSCFSVLYCCYWVWHTWMRSLKFHLFGSIVLHPYFIAVQIEALYSIPLPSLPQLPRMGLEVSSGQEQSREVWHDYCIFLPIIQQQPVIITAEVWSPWTFAVEHHSLKWALITCYWLTWSGKGRLRFGEGIYSIFFKN